jgi:hypothetical protein
LSTTAPCSSQRLGRLQLEARQLQHVQIGQRLIEQIERRHTRVAAGEHAPPGGLGHVRDQARDRALAVGAGDADHRRAHRAREQFDVADDLDAARARLRAIGSSSETPGDISSCVAPSSSDRSKPPRRMSRRSRSAQLGEARRLACACRSR